MSHIANYEATLAARYGIVQAYTPSDDRLALLGLRSTDPAAITVQSQRRELTGADRRRICRLACKRVGLQQPRFNRHRTDTLERCISRGRTQRA
jgi:hypothetical protein